MNIESQSVYLETSSTPMELYVARPDDNRAYPAVMVGFELFGLTSYVRRVTDEIARLGYVAVAPDFYHRSGQHIRLEANDAGRKRGFEFLSEINRETIREDILAVEKFLTDDKRITNRTGFVGLSIGGHVAFLAATLVQLRACIAFYPGWLTNTDITLSQPEPTIKLSNAIHAGCKVVIIAGEQDKLLPQSVRDEIAETLTSAEVDHALITYPDTGHGFLCEERSETYNPIAAQDAWGRVRAILKDRL